MELPYDYDSDNVSALLYTIIRQNSAAQALSWLEQRTKALQDTGSLQQFNLTFSAIPRFTGKALITLSEDTAARLQQTAHGFFVQGYTLDRLVRTWWLLQWPAADRNSYVRAIEGLFNAAEMNELVALYGALPLLPWAQEWKLRTAEGIRSNIGTVLEAIMLHNAYPARYLNEPAWNQLVLKAFFTEKPVHYIIGLDERANARLAAILVDYAHERWAAGRPVNPMLWRLVTRFINEANISDIQRVWRSAENIEREAAALACYYSPYAPARALLKEKPVLEQEIESGRLSWSRVAEKQVN
ncbi:MAG TPA: EboA domain-containing protein [Chitinophaga sp.]|uniref:EboA domain-containing protein n=1 Tax=Chitinophaga sp. TaxID=1869181 RepID=UPI002DB7DA34|nr:EboA domain-containing protein [Chitinophaga sp.]HEU4554682.1 EboA domain-containing protein [Chitinophaga sp.]